VTVAVAYPAALAAKVAEPVLEESAVMVTFCAVFQLDGVKVSVPLGVWESLRRGAAAEQRGR
jgi:hypothetical protein